MKRTEPLWSKDSTYALKLYKWITWPIGTWPFGCENAFSIFRLTVVIISQITYLISVISEIFQDCNTLHGKIDYVGNLSCAVMCLVKVLLTRFHFNKMYILLSSAIKDWDTEKEENSLKIMRSYAHTSRTFYIGQLSFAFFAIGVMIISNVPPLLVDRSKFENVSGPIHPLPLPLDCFYKGISKRTNIWIYILQSVQLIYTTIGFCGTDVYFFGVAMHICGQLEILKKNMSDFGAIDDKVQLNSNLRSLIKRHNHLINMCQQLEDTFSYILIIQLFFNCLIIVVIGLLMIILFKSGNIAFLSRCATGIVVIMMQFFIYCYAGDNLTTLNEMLMDAIYSSPWYNFSQTLGKELLFIMLRTRTKFHITAGKFFYMDVENYKKILKASISYISVLLVFLKQDD